MSICEKCGRDLHRALVERYPKMRSDVFADNKLSEIGPDIKIVNIPRERVQEFNANLHELLEFAAWVCEVDPKKLCRSDMMKATGAWHEIARRIERAQERFGG